MNRYKAFIVLGIFIIYISSYFLFALSLRWVYYALVGLFVLLLIGFYFRKKESKKNKAGALLILAAYLAQVTQYIFLWKIQPGGAGVLFLAALGPLYLILLIIGLILLYQKP
ncbi:hypothetical protein CO038_03645 [Candidatus Pacearchaeota archaeon CG_4_9_14_0_2_um_filter_39_13]|nr:MAG: hypothetical protein CO038_03645 [Candidatus Pacearchaeota archaeon CG_4_9_14_0_2_um_filter_39_13]